MKKKKMLWEYIADFSRTQTEVFPFEDLVAYVQDRKGDVDELLLTHEARRSEDLFENFEMKEERFVPRRVVFEGANARITPLAEEVEGGYLMPGHRFIPYFAKHVFPPTVQVSLPDGSVLETRTLRVPISQALLYLMYFGQALALEYLLKDHPINADALDCENSLDSETLVTVTVLDCRSFFETSGFKPGDSLMLTIDDWEHGKCSAEVIPKTSEVLDFQKIHEWADALREGMDGVIDYYSAINSVEQMARMLAFASEDVGGSILKNPPLSLASFFNSQKELLFPTVGNISFFWLGELGEPREYILTGEDNLMEAETELGGHLKELGISMEESTVEAYMLSALAAKEDDPRKVLARVIEGRELIFHSSEDQQEFNHLWQEFWDDVRSEDVQVDDDFLRLRNEFLRINDRCLAVMRRFDRQKDLPEDFMQSQDFLELSMTGSVVEMALSSLNHPLLENKEEIFEMFGEIAISAEQCLSTF